MLKDRRVLLEQEIDKVKTLASLMYLDIVTHDGLVQNGHYQDLRNKIMNLQCDLDLVNVLISKGHK
jgi:hypothetical protein